MKILETQSPTAPDGRRLTLLVVQHPYRPSGRRLILRDGPRVLFDTDDCYDLGNALNALDQWATANLKPALTGAA